MSNEVIQKAKLVKEASIILQNKTTNEKNKALKAIVVQLKAGQMYILSENKKDIQEAKETNISASMLDRLTLNEDRIQAMCDQIELVVALPDPVGELLEEYKKENGLIISKRRVPLGALGMIYEARPNVTIDAATLSLKTINTVLLRDSASAKYSNRALV